MLKITDQDIQNVSSNHGYEYAAVVAVKEIESKGDGFSTWKDEQGNDVTKTKILFEGHVFWSQLAKAGIAPAKKTAGNEDILYQKWTRNFYSRLMSGEYARLEKARKIHFEAANRSASWGMFQIMGFNHQDAGYQTVVGMIEDYKTGEKAQLDSFCRFVKKQNLDICLKESAIDLPFHITRKNGVVEEVDRWEYFAYRYNGAGYEANGYHTKLKAAYEKAKKGI